MRTYYSEGALRLVGKGWEVRRQLHVLMARCPHPDYAVSALLSRLMGQAASKTVSAKKSEICQWAKTNL